jgi:hypothetical protein
MTKIILGVVALVGVVCIVIFVVAAVTTTQTQQEFGGLLDVCRGNGLASAPAYDAAASGTHRAMGVKKSSTGAMHIYPYAVPDEAMAETQTQTELVLCIDEAKETLIERCPYGEDDEKADVTKVVERYAFEQEVTLFAAQTGAVVASETLSSQPDECLEEEAFRTGQETIVIKAGEISDDEIEEWLRPHVIVR